MNISVLKKSIIDSLSVAAALTLMLALASADSYLPVPVYESLEDYSGVLTSLEAVPNSSEWKFKLTKNNDHRTFYVPSESCGNLNDKIVAGDHIQAKLNRRFWLFGSIRAWEVTKNSEVIVRYSPVNKHSVNRIVTALTIGFLGFVVGFTLLFYGQKNEKP